MKFNFSVGDSIECKCASNCKKGLALGGIYEVSEVMKGRGLAFIKVSAFPDYELRANRFELVEDVAAPEVVPAFTKQHTYFGEESETPAPFPSAYPDNNPKSLVGASKVPLHLIPGTALVPMAAAHADGAEKYGAYNWREVPIASSVYMSAIKRHMDAWFDGEDFAKDSGVHHLGHVMASCALLLDSEAVGTLVDDRPKSGAVAKAHEAYYSQDQKEETNA